MCIRLYRTVAVSAAFRLGGCDLVAEFAVSYRHGSASRAGAATRASYARASNRSSSGGGVAAATKLIYPPPARADRRRPFHGLFWAPVTHGSNGPPPAAPAQLRLSTTPASLLAALMHTLFSKAWQSCPLITRLSRFSLIANVKPVMGFNSFFNMFFLFYIDEVIHL